MMIIFCVCTNVGVPHFFLYSPSQPHGFPHSIAFHQRSTCNSLLFFLYPLVLFSHHHFVSNCVSALSPSFIIAHESFFFLVSFSFCLPLLMPTTLRNELFVHCFRFARFSVLFIVVAVSNFVISLSLLVLMVTISLTFVIYFDWYLLNLLFRIFIKYPNFPHLLLI